MALLVIDVQREYFDEDGPAYVEHARDIVGNVNRLIDAFRAASLPIVFLRHAHRADGSDAGRMGDFSAPGEEDAFVEGTPRAELIPELHVGPQDVIVIKRRYSAFLGTDLEAVLRTAGVRAVVICGLMTSFCVQAGACDVIVIKLMKSGGILNALKVNAIAETAGIPVTMGNMGESSLGLAAHLHVSIALANVDHWDAALPWRPGGLLRDIGSGLTGELREGVSTMLVPDGPGLGIVLDEEAIAAQRVTRRW